MERESAQGVQSVHASSFFAVHLKSVKTKGIESKCTRCTPN